MAQEKNLHPNLDWPAGRLYHALGLEIPLYTPIFVMSRITGWSAHVNEQLQHNRLIRPRSRYIGPELRSMPNFVASWTFSRRSWMARPTRTSLWPEP